VRVAGSVIALMPQWAFLDVLGGEARRYPSFHLLMSTDATGLIREVGGVVGVTTRDGEIRAELVIAADGRHSALREAAGFDVLDIGAPMDVLWLRLSKSRRDPGQTLGRIDAGRMVIMLDRND